MTKNVELTKPKYCTSILKAKMHLPTSVYNNFESGLNYIIIPGTTNHNSYVFKYV